MTHPTFEITERRVTGKEKQHMPKCEAPGCGGSGRFVACFLGAYKVRLCSRHRIEWAQAWDSAKSNWSEAA